MIRSQDKVGDKDIEVFRTLDEALTTLLDGRRRCEYDKENRIKGKWPYQTCRDAFREEYREIRQEKFDKWKKILEEKNKATVTSEHKTAYNPESSSHTAAERAKLLNVEPLIPKAKKPSQPSKPKPQARSSVPVTSARIEHENEDTLESATAAVATVWERSVEVVVYLWALVSHTYDRIWGPIGYGFARTMMWLQQ